ncbi:hypothetical protein V8F63_13660 [Brevundimonas sp. LF-1]|uniref:hypothetical protein n=1 Tax=Brevundimonas sp. LF-1 TaxID=3126100 RepID=UPI0030DF280A
MIDARRMNRRGVLAAGSGLALAAATGPVWAGAKDADARLDALWTPSFRPGWTGLPNW